MTSHVCRDGGRCLRSDTHRPNSMPPPPPSGTSRTTYCKPPSYRAHHLCRRRLQCWVNKAEPLVSAAKLAARDRTLNEWFKVSSEQLSQLINLLMAVHVWKEAGVGDVGVLQSLHPFKSRQMLTLPRVVRRVRSFVRIPESSGFCRISLVFPHHVQTSEKCCGTNGALHSDAFRVWMKGRNPHPCPPRTAVHLEGFRIQEHFQWYPVCILVIIQLFWPRKGCFF